MTSVLLDEQIAKLTEPVISGAYFVFAKGPPVEQVSVDPWNASWAGWRNAPLNGEPVAVHDTDPNWRKAWRWRSMRTFARPLVDVTDQTALKDLVISPLLTMIREHQAPDPSL